MLDVVLATGAAVASLLAAGAAVTGRPGHLARRLPAGVRHLGDARRPDDDGPLARGVAVRMAATVGALVAQAAGVRRRPAAV